MSQEKKQARNKKKYDNMSEEKRKAIYENNRKRYIPAKDRPKETPWKRYKSAEDIS